MKLLIVSPDAYSIFHPETNYIFGGIEIESGHHANGLAQLGVEVVVATRDQGVTAHKIGKITIAPIPGLYGKGYWEKRRTWKGRIQHRLFGDQNPNKTIEELMTAINPDAGYIMGMSPEALKLARYCKRNNKGFIFRVAHDKDLLPEEKHMREWAKISADEAREVISSADVVLAQTPFQHDELLSAFGRESEMMFPPIELDLSVEKTEKEFDVLWIGRNNSFKRPEKLAEIAASLKEYRFCMIFNKVEPVDWQRTVDSLTPNVHVVESVPANQVENYFRKSRVFLSTSLHEGFPNTFLQAAKNRLPVVSMGSDPNGMLSVYHGGKLCGDDVSSTVDAIRALISDQSEYERHAAASRIYVEQFNDRRKINQQFLGLLMQVLAVKSQVTS